MNKLKNLKNKLVVAGLTLGPTLANAADPGWATGGASGDSVKTAFEDVMSYAAPIGIGVVVAVAGVRVVIKLINRGAGK